MPSGLVRFARGTGCGAAAWHLDRRPLDGAAPVGERRPTASRSSRLLARGTAGLPSRELQVRRCTWSSASIVAVEAISIDRPMLPSRYRRKTAAHPAASGFWTGDRPRFWSDGNRARPFLISQGIMAAESATGLQPASSSAATSPNSSSSSSPFLPVVVAWRPRPAESDTASDPGLRD